MLCIIARADLTGLGVQSRNWVRLLKPQKLVVIDSTSFNNNEQHLEWYKGYGGYTINGFIKNHEINAILQGVDVLLTFEIPYSYELVRVARSKGIKVIIQNNWEFTDYLKQPHLPLPDLLVNHSYWHLDEQKQMWPEITEYCATPVFIEDYNSIYLQNIEKKGKKRFLHVAGRKTYEDRNGTQDLLAAMKLVPKSIDFELVIKSQTTDVGGIDDPRITVDTNSPVDEKELYCNFDAMIMPRKYGGACLPMTEALSAGLPVIMPDVSPNNQVLPKEWLVTARHAGSFNTRTEIDIFQADHNSLADIITEWALEDSTERKITARKIAEKEYSSQVVLEKWGLLMERIKV